MLQGFDCVVQLLFGKVLLIYSFYQQHMRLSHFSITTSTQDTFNHYGIMFTAGYLLKHSKMTFISQNLKMFREKGDTWIFQVQKLLLILFCFCQEDKWQSIHRLHEM